LITVYHGIQKVNNYMKLFTIMYERFTLYHLCHKSAKTSFLHDTTYTGKAKSTTSRGCGFTWWRRGEYSIPH